MPKKTKAQIEVELKDVQEKLDKALSLLGVAAARTKDEIFNNPLAQLDESLRSWYLATQEVLPPHLK